MQSVDFYRLTDAVHAKLANASLMPISVVEEQADNGGISF